MQLSKRGYFADFVVYPLCVVALASAALGDANRQAAAHWGVAVLVGLLLWTMLEYLLHRIALHRIAYLVPMHELHHRAPRAYVGIPVWLSLPLFGCVVWLPLWRVVGFTSAAGLTVGVMSGYFWYGLVHHLIHHRDGKSMPRYLRGLRIRHLRHHHSPKSGNFGVTTALWDHAFDTVVDV